MLFLHGHCSETEHYKKWYVLPAQLARAGYVVVVPELPATAGGTYPWKLTHPDVALINDVLNWIRSALEYSWVLMPAHFTGIVGHS
jgi:hypothetical protein